MILSSVGFYFDSLICTHCGLFTRIEMVYGRFPPFLMEKVKIGMRKFEAGFMHNKFQHVWMYQSFPLNIWTLIFQYPKRLKYISSMVYANLLWNLWCPDKEGIWQGQAMELVGMQILHKNWSVGYDTARFIAYFEVSVHLRFELDLSLTKSLGFSYK